MTRVVRGFQQRRRAFLIGLLAGLVCAAVWLVAVGTSAEAQGVSGYTEVTGAAVTVPGFTSATGSATCPTGDVVVSGGYTLVGGNMEIDISAPLDAKGTMSSTTWTVTGFDNGDGQGTFTPYAICVSSSTAGYSEASKAQSVNGVSSAQLTETCPAGSVITGGGFGFAAANTALMINESDPTSSSTVSKTTWTVFVANSARTTQSLTTYVVCVSDTISGYSEQLAQGSAAGVMSATCPSGSLVIGGGVFAPGPPNTSVDAPVVQNAAGAFVVSNSSWSVDAASTGGGVIGSIAICAAPAPTVNSLKPSNGPAAGGNMIAVVGSNFTGATAVNFGSTPATSFSVVSSIQINAVVPAGSGAVDVTVTTPGGTSPTVSGDIYKYVPSVTSVSPTSGPTTGGTTVTINGTGFTGATGVSFGGTAATFSVKSSSQISATAPTGVAGTVDITVTTPGGTSTTSTNDQYTYVTPPTVTRVSPSSGPAAGGTSVTIAGTNFTGATAVSFGGTAASTFTVTSAGSITATSPAGSGAVDVTVTIPGGGTSATNSSDVFKYVPSVTSVSPASGPTGGGTSVTINGTGFTGATAVSFGGTAASSYTVNSSSKITATAPAEPAGIVDITVTTPSATSTTSTADQFTYQEPPTATISSPTNSQSYSLNQVVATSFSCTEGANGPGIQSCTDSNGATNGTGTLNTSNIGAHTYTVTAVSQDGQGATKSINYTVIGPPTATITAPANNQTYNLNQSVSTSFSCSDSINGPGIQTCTDSNGATGGTGALDTSTAGAHTYTVTATSKDGQTGTKTINYTVIGPPTATITAPANNGTYNLNQVVATAFSCTEASGGPGIQTCTDSNNASGGTGALNTSTTGAHTYTVTATSKDGQTGMKTINYTVIGPPTATITAPANNGTYNLNQVVATAFSCTEASGGPGIQTCTDSNGATNGVGALDTSTTGPHAYTVTATSQDGQTGTKSINYTVIGPPTATITAPTNNQNYNLNANVATAFSCADATGGPGIQTCIDSNGATGGAGELLTSVSGLHTYTVTATSKDGQTATRTINYTVGAPPTAAIGTPADNQSYNLNQTVATTFSCARGASGAPVQTCIDSNGASGGAGALDTTTPGAHAYTVTATSQDGQTGTKMIHYTVIGPPTATITTPADNQSYAFNQPVSTAYGCAEATNGPGIQACTDSNNASGGTGALDTSTAGAHTYTVTATSKDGQSATTTIHYTVAGPVPPTVAGGAPTNQTSSGATPAGTVNPEGMPTQAYFEYGLDLGQRGPGADTTLYDQSTTPQPVGSDSANHTVSVPLAGLIPGALYHVRLVAVNAAGTTFGPDQTFTTAQSAPPPPPVIGQSEDVQPVSGKVFIKNRQGQFVPLTGATQITSGSVIDATHGSLQVTAAVGKHKTEHGTFGGAIFKLTQAKTGLTTLSLLEAAFKGAPSFALCTVHKKAGDASAAALSSKTLQLLHASAHGKFTTQGKYSAATVRGTNWTIADRCDGTLTHDITDSVAVTDFVRHKTLILHAGQSYLAAARNLGRRGS